MDSGSGDAAAADGGAETAVDGMVDGGAPPESAAPTASDPPVPAPEPGQLIQLIGEDQGFNPRIAEVMADPWHMSKLGFDYNVLAVFGSQSTGKSTLLNRLFGTRFDVMSDAERRQTTKGIWCAKDHERPLIIMDVEGADGRERGEQQDFERKTALFCISIAEVVIMNMWEHMVGLYQGANMGLLKTVFEVNLQLFEKRGSPKTLLLFVIRDYLGVTPFDNLRKILQDDLKKLWDSISKPKGLENTRITDFFDLQFTSLPHKYNNPQDFEEACVALRGRFRNPSHPDYVFQREYHKHIPADGFPRYAEDVWSTITSNRDLDLPTQQELLAQYRCDEIMSEVWTNDFLGGIREVREAVDKGQVVNELGNRIGGLKAFCLDKFDEDAQRYQKDVYEKKRADFGAKMNSELKLIHQAQLKNLQRSCVAQFKATLKQKLDPSAQAGGSSAQSGLDFATQLRAVQREILDHFSKVAAESVLQGTDWTYDEMMRELEDDLLEHGNAVRQEELKRSIELQEKTIAANLSDLVTGLMNKGEPSMWADIWKVFTETTDACVAKLTERAGQLDLGTDETIAADSKLKRSAWDLLRKRIGDEMSDINMLSRFRNRFEREFRYDEHGVPRVWKPGDDIDDAFRVAREATNRMFGLFQTVGVEPSTVNEFLGSEDAVSAESLRLLTDSKMDDLFTRIQGVMDGIFTDAKRAVVNATAQVPPWMILLMVALGWNEAVAVFSNPFYVFLLVLGGIVFYVLTATGLWGPAKALVLQTTRQIGSQISSTMDSSGINLGNVVKSAKDLTNAALDAGSSLMDAHREADIAMEPVSPTGERASEPRTPGPSRVDQLRYRGASTPGSFTERAQEKSFETPAKYVGASRS